MFIPLHTLQVHVCLKSLKSKPTAEEDVESEEEGEAGWEEDNMEEDSTEEDTQEEDKAEDATDLQLSSFMARSHCL